MSLEEVVEQIKKKGEEYPFCTRGGDGLVKISDVLSLLEPLLEREKQLHELWKEKPNSSVAFVSYPAWVREFMDWSSKLEKFLEEDEK